MLAGTDGHKAVNFYQYRDVNSSCILPADAQDSYVDFISEPPDDTTFQESGWSL